MDFQQKLKMDNDCIVLLGDIKKYELNFILEQNNGNLPVIGIKGNHDLLNQFADFPEIINVHNHVQEVLGITWIGIEGCCVPYLYRDNNFCEYTQEDIKSLCKDYPRDVDILLTHASLESGRKESSYNYYEGLTAGKKYFKKSHAKINLHGHLHQTSEECRKSYMFKQSIGVYMAERISIIL